MKKFFLTLAFALVAMVSSVFAQNIQTYSWGNGVSFGLLEGMNIVENTNMKFTATNDEDNFAVSIVPIEFQEIKDHELGEYLGELAFGEMGMSAQEGDYETREIEVENGEGLAVIGQNADGDYCICALFICEEKMTGCFMFEIFPEEYAEAAGIILGSVYFK